MRKEKFAHYTASLSQRAVLYEVSTTPKPGLVDRNDNGAHYDMNFFTFMASSSILYKYFYDCTLKGFDFDESNCAEQLDSLRAIGKSCEDTMYKVTKGVNTHKGIIFSMGILCAAIGSIYIKNSDKQFTYNSICSEVKKMTQGITYKDFEKIKYKKILTHGEKLYKLYGFNGIRGEVESGFNTIHNTVNLLIDRWKTCGFDSLNELFIEAFFNIMAVNDDTNVVSRAGIDGLNYTKMAAADFIACGGINNTQYISKIEKMNDDFIKMNISPGGSADLLAVSIFFALIILGLE